VPYASAAELRARAGGIGQYWTSGSSRRPNEEDLLLFLDQVSDEIDGLVGALGHTLPIASAAADALKGTVLDGALMLALEAQFPGGVPDDVRTIYTGARDRYARSWKMLDEGKHPAIALLESEPGTPSASTLWSEEPQYGQVIEKESDRNVNLRPGVFRGMKL
jgi:hypothetical protein